jgi:hypothetical protein
LESPTNPGRFKVLEITGLTTVFSIYDTVAAAVAK